MTIRKRKWFIERWIETEKNSEMLQTLERFPYDTSPLES